MNILLITIISLCAIGVISAIILFLVAKKFKVEEDPRIDTVCELLPGANCGGCGFPGCRGLAEAAVKADTLDGKRVRESQEEIAELFHVSKGKLNPLMQSLVASGCIQKYRARSGYTVTPLGAEVVRHIGMLEGLADSQVAEQDET